MAGAGGIGSMRRGIRCWKGWRRKHERRGKACGLIRTGAAVGVAEECVESQAPGSTAIYARLNTKAVDRALQAQADRLCSLVAEPVEVLPALTQDLQLAAIGGERLWG